jgi:hypothetical protein
MFIVLQTGSHYIAPNDLELLNSSDLPALLGLPGTWDYRHNGTWLEFPFQFQGTMLF